MNFDFLTFRPLLHLSLPPKKKKPAVTFSCKRSLFFHRRAAGHCFMQQPCNFYPMLSSLLNKFHNDSNLTMSRQHSHIDTATIILMPVPFDFQALANTTSIIDTVPFTSTVRFFFFSVPLYYQTE